MKDLYLWSIRHGSKPLEMRAMFNQCAYMWIVKAYTEGNRWHWQGCHGHSATEPSGWENANARTRGELVRMYAKQCPNMRVMAQHGDRFLVVQEGNPELFEEESEQ